MFSKVIWPVVPEPSRPVPVMLLLQQIGAKLAPHRPASDGDAGLGRLGLPHRRLSRIARGIRAGFERLEAEQRDDHGYERDHCEDQRGYHDRVRPVA